MREEDHLIYTDKGNTLAIYKDDEIDSVALEFDITLKKVFTYNELKDMLLELIPYLPDNYDEIDEDIHNFIELSYNKKMFILNIGSISKMLLVKVNPLNPSELIFELIDNLINENNLLEDDEIESELIYLKPKEITLVYQFIQYFISELG